MATENSQLNHTELFLDRFSSSSPLTWLTEQKDTGTAQSLSVLISYLGTDWSIYCFCLFVQPPPSDLTYMYGKWTFLPISTQHVLIHVHPLIHTSTHSLTHQCQTLGTTQGSVSCSAHAGHLGERVVRICKYTQTHSHTHKVTPVSVFVT